MKRNEAKIEFHNTKHKISITEKRLEKMAKRMRFHMTIGTVRIYMSSIYLCQKKRTQENVFYFHQKLGDISTTKIMLLRTVEQLEQGSLWSILMCDILVIEIIIFQFRTFLFQIVSFSVWSSLSFGFKSFFKSSCFLWYFLISFDIDFFFISPILRSS